MYRFFIFLLSAFFLPVQVFAAAVLTDPNAAGHPSSVFYDNSKIRDTSVVQKEGVVSDTKAPTLEKRTLTEPLLLDLPGVGDTCTIGVPDIQAWHIAPDAVIEKKEDLKEILETALVNDTRLRRIAVLDNRLDLYYLMPAYRFKVIPVNYHLHIVADGATLRMSLENPSWVAKVENKHAEVSAAFATYIPELLNDETVQALDGTPLAVRDAKLVEVIATIMTHVEVMPHAGTFFSCYILPFLAYIIGVVILALFIIWYFVRKARRMARRRLFALRKNSEENDEEEDESGGFSPKVHYVPGRPDQ